MLGNVDDSDARRARESWSSPLAATISRQCLCPDILSCIHEHSHRTAADFASNDVHRCICGAQFCYDCGQRWKTCLYPRWDENRLLGQLPAAAGQANNNDGVNDESDDEDSGEDSDEESEEQSEEESDEEDSDDGESDGDSDDDASDSSDTGGSDESNSADDSSDDDESSDSEDDCKHEHWRYVLGRNVCDGCGMVYPCFIFRCRDCTRIDLCAECRRERRRGQ